MTRQEFLNKWKPIRTLISGIAYTMEEANKADDSAENGVNSNIAGEPFNLLDKAWRKIVALQYGDETYLHVNWGGNGDFYQDIKHEVFNHFVKSEFPEETIKR